MHDVRAPMVARLGDLGYAHGLAAKRAVAAASFRRGHWDVTLNNGKIATLLRLFNRQISSLAHRASAKKGTPICSPPSVQPSGWAGKKNI
jgi:hypothetical protein